MRSIWSGSISFGLVNIPVKVYPAVEDKDIKFRYIHRECHTPINYVKRCPTCDRDVEKEEIVRGYEYRRGQYILFTEEELEKLPLPTTRIIEISDFVDQREVDPLYFSRSYYLAPAEGGPKAYALLYRAMVDTGQMALAKVTLRQRESLVGLRAYQNALLMETMAYAEEIRPLAAIPELHYDVHLEPREVEMAVRLIESLAASFEPQKYKDHYREALEELIGAKVAGREIELAPAPAPANVVNLLEALQASIEKAEAERQPTKAGPAKTTRRRAAK